ncbi:hypothetical protein [Cohnella fermenti]|uniref:Sulfotransferase family protein n=1 Tax=Cohnella fermenti TaxID=2565925 RepID=A0A4S4BYA3_9BACL|nr:hypothetical protein [Cohnella fermenti]THF79522.1 hypothetical protein E6C55_12110 [Cohnella fermenti]
MDNRDNVSVHEAAGEVKPASARPLLLYVHIPKTAGTSVAAMFHEQFQEKLGVVDMGNREHWLNVLKLLPCRYDCLIGHFAYGLHAELARSCEYASMMRNPIAAMVSYHSYIVRRTDHPLHACMGDGSLEHFLSLPAETLAVFRNYQTAMLTGKPGASAEETIRLIEREYPIVGTVEQLEETVFLLQQRYGWGDIHMRRENVGNSAVQRNKLRPTEYRRIAELVGVDLMVYAYVRARMEKTVQALPKQQQSAIREFKATGLLHL